MVSFVSVFFVAAIVLTLVLILRLIYSFHQDEGIVELDMRDKRERGSL